MSKTILALTAAAIMAAISPITLNAQTRVDSGPNTMRPAAALQVRGMRADQYVKKSAMSDLFEIEASKLALQRTENPDVKAFAQRMVDDHTQSTQKLQGLLQSASIGATPPTALDRAHQRMLEQLQNASAKQFDRLYMQMQVKGHQAALKVQQGYSRHGDSDQLKSFASDARSMVQDHLNEARQILRGLDRHRAG